ncbi:MAG: carbamate kinase [Lachnospiraceae bacterium]|nr:carbamate kinase [Lachnospiraceae bacterium]
MEKKKIVVALGRKALGKTLPEQQKAVAQTAIALADLIEDGHQLIITHSNGPQVGMIDAAIRDFSKRNAEYTVAPLAICDAMSQGYIGYDLQNSLRGELLKRGIVRPVCTIITQVQVDPYDDAFFEPTKVIGRLLTKEQADMEVEKGNVVVAVEGGFKKIVAAPKPLDIVEIDSIKTLANAGHVVIACGGGGIPVMEQNHLLKGASAVIEKDIAAAKLAHMVNADLFMILTNVDKVCMNYDTKDEEPLDTLSCSQAVKLSAENQFSEGTMLPKIQACVDFVSSKEERKAIITSLSKAKDALHGRTGTIITK